YHQKISPLQSCSRPLPRSSSLFLPQFSPWYPLATPRPHPPRYRRHLFPVIHQMISFGIQDILFQQDNSPVHKAYNVINWLERNSIEVVEHPPYSPDLNPIKHVWVE